jgi:hypothetical protein
MDGKAGLHLLLELDSLEGDAKLMADPIPVRKLSAYVKNFFLAQACPTWEL